MLNPHAQKAPGYGSVFCLIVFSEAALVWTFLGLDDVQVIRNQRDKVQTGAGYRRRLLIDP